MDFERRHCYMRNGFEDKRTIAFLIMISFHDYFTVGNFIYTRSN